MIYPDTCPHSSSTSRLSMTSSQGWGAIIRRGRADLDEEASCNPRLHSLLTRNVEYGWPMGQLTISCLLDTVCHTWDPSPAIIGSAGVPCTRIQSVGSGTMDTQALHMDAKILYPLVLLSPLVNCLLGAFQSLTLGQ